jgi:hypothetical protein
VVQIKPHISQFLLCKYICKCTNLYANLSVRHPHSKTTAYFSSVHGTRRHKEINDHSTVQDSSLTPTKASVFSLCVLQYNEFLGKAPSYLILTHVLGEIFSREPSPQVHPYIRENVWDGATLLSSFLT